MPNLTQQLTWSVELATPQSGYDALYPLPDPLTGSKTLSAIHQGITVTTKIVAESNYARVTIKLGSETTQQAFASLRCDLGLDPPWTFLGPADKHEIYRQSPHDPRDHVVDMAKQPVPMIAARTPDGFMVAIGDNPATCQNYCTQELDPANAFMRLSSGDDGRTPGLLPRKSKVEPFYSVVKPGEPQTFELIMFHTSANDLNGLRRSVFDHVSNRWDGPEDHFGALAFASNYMHYRCNETGHSDYWVCPGIDYANKQYSRDAFWQSLILPLTMDQQCYNDEAVARYTGAERPLFDLIWAYRIEKRGGIGNRQAAQFDLDYIESHAHNGRYYASESPERRDFQSWYDLCAFDEDDVISYNQGLLCVALRAAKELGLNPRTPYAQAVDAYRQLFLVEQGYYPLSLKKPEALCVDALAGDLLSQYLFEEALLPGPSVHEHLAKLVAVAKTPHGFKVTCAANGDYLAPDSYSVAEYHSRVTATHAQGHYQWGGSWYLYDMLCLMSCALHEAPDAEELMIWRTALEFERHGTWHEHMDTATGAPGKPNQGWNAAVYAIWRDLFEQGRVTRRFTSAVNAVLDPKEQVPHAR